MAKLASWVSGLLVVLIGIVAALIALRFVPVQDIQASARPSQTPGEVPAVARLPSAVEMARDVSNQNVFGEAGAPPEIKRPTETAPTATRLNLSLVGVYTANPKERAMAMISNGGKPEEVFAVGDTIVGRAKLKEVLQTEVIIDNNGRDETLKLPEIVATGGSNPGMANLPQGNLPGPTGNQQGAQITLPDAPSDIRKMLVENPGMMNKLVSAAPHRVNGRIVGYKITPKQQGGMLANYGVLPGDVVTRVNGIALANQKNAIRALRKLVKAPSIDLTILRDNAELPISIALE